MQPRLAKGLAGEEHHPRTSENGSNGSFDMRHNSRVLYDGNDRAGARSMMKSIGFTDEDLKKPIIGIANTWIETMPCNYNLRWLPST